MAPWAGGPGALSTRSRISQAATGLRDHRPPTAAAAGGTIIFQIYFTQVRPRKDDLEGSPSIWILMPISLLQRKGNGKKKSP